VRSERINASVDLDRMWKKISVAYFKRLSENSPGRTRKVNANAPRK
jgi:hypothetical protein